MLLAIDTATQISSIALFDGLSLLAEDTWVTAGHHSAELAPAVQRLLARSGIDVGNLTALAVCVGPGTYTGLRIGVSLAKGMAAARDLPLVGLTTMEILALGQPQADAGLVTVVQAGRGRVISQLHQWQHNRWTARGDAVVTDWETLVSRIDSPVIVTGEVDAAGKTALEDAAARDVPVTLAAAALRLRRAGFLAGDAWVRLQAEPERFAPEKVVPVYVAPREASS